MARASLSFRLHVLSTRRLCRPRAPPVSFLSVPPPLSTTTTKGLVRAGDTLSLGPDDAGAFVRVRVKDIHRNRRPARLVKAGQLATFALETDTVLRRGQVLVADGVRPKVCSAFSAQILLLRAATTLSVDREVRLSVVAVRCSWPSASLFCLSGCTALSLPTPARVFYSFFFHSS